MKLTGLIFAIFICYNAFAQGPTPTNGKIENKTRKQLVDTRSFQPSKIILTDQNGAFSDRATTKNSRIRLDLSSAETTDLSIIYARKKCEFAIAIEDLFNVDWNTAKFSVRSRLRDEPTPVEEIDFNSGIPFLVRLKLSFSL